MKFRGICKISVLAQSQSIFVAPCVFLWISVVLTVLETKIESLTMLLIGAIITIYQQSSVQHEDFVDGFFEHCKFNCGNILSYALAKSVSVWITTVLPLAILLFVFGFLPSHVAMIAMQWIILSICVSCTMLFMPTMGDFVVNPLGLLLAWLPLLTASSIFLADYMHCDNQNSLLIFLGCDTILVSAVFLPFYFKKPWI